MTQGVMTLVAAAAAAAATIPLAKTVRNRAVPPKLHSTVSTSGKATAAARARDCVQKKTALYRDPLLETMVAEQVLQMQPIIDWMASQPFNNTTSHPGSERCTMTHARARFIHDCVKSFCSSLPSTSRLQVVCLGSGYDTRPWMEGLGLGGRQADWFAVDVKEVLDDFATDVVAAGAQLPPQLAARQAPSGIMNNVLPAPLTLLLNNLMGQPAASSGSSSSSSSTFPVNSQSPSITTGSSSAAAAGGSAGSAGLEGSAGPADVSSWASAVGPGGEVVELAGAGTRPTSPRFPLQVSRLELVACDLRQDPRAQGGLLPALHAAGFQSGLPTLWICEGLLHYLTEPAIGSLAAAAASVSGPGSRLAGDVVGAGMIAFVQRRVNGAQRQGDKATTKAGGNMENHFVWGSDDPAGFLAQHGWAQCRYQAEGQDYSQALGRAFLMQQDINSPLARQYDIKYMFMEVEK
mmetsp:Transcript_39391/g.87641  ORF Transcript_39391/g.87641 Transcript_39391/m.87641 type:complete len:463 (-) Transcript_39391:256-1644(-)